MTTSGWFVKSKQFKRGKSVESFLDDYFAGRGFAITETTPHQERDLCLGDRIFTKGGKRFYIEYKSGIQTHYTGNVFIETISVDDPQRFRQGWLYTCQADYLLYAALLDGLILVFVPDKLRTIADGLRAKFPERPTGKEQNKGYNTHGLIVPLDYAIRHLAEKVLEVRYGNGIDHD